MMNWKIGKPNKQEELCYSIEARPYATQEVALKWFSIEGNITSNPKQNAVRNMRNYIKRHRDLQEALDHKPNRFGAQLDSPSQGNREGTLIGKKLLPLHMEYSSHKLKEIRSNKKQ